MIRRTAPSFASLLLLLLAAAGAPVLAGPISPPAGAIGAGGPVPTRPQVEPRRPIPDPAVALSFPIRLTEPGSYFLTQDIVGVSGQHGIQIEASQVTLDLNGFTLRGVAGSLEGIGNGTSTTLNNVVVRNGTISSWAQDGIDLDGTSYCTIEDVHATGNGAVGVRAGLRSMVRRVHANLNGSHGVQASGDSMVSHCLAGSNGGDGFNLGSWGTIEHCSALQNTGDGIEANENATIRHNTSHANGNATTNGAGVRTTGANNRVTDNYVHGNRRGLSIDSSGSTVAANIVRNNTTNYVFAADNKLELVIGQIPETIAWAASVRLDGTLNAAANQDGLTITANDVTIDLGGHALNGVRGSGSTGTGIAIANNVSGITVRNGTIRNWRVNGISALQSDRNTFENLHIDNVGANGIAGRSFTIVRNCVITNSAFDGVFLEGNCLVEGNSIGNSGENGIDIGFSSIIRHNAVRVSGTASANDGAGIEVSADNYVHDNTLDDHGAAGTGGNGNKGIRLVGRFNRIEANNVTNAYFSFSIEAGNNLLIRNSAADIPSFGTVFRFINNSGPTTSLGPIIDVNTIGSNNSPHANYIF